MVSPICLGEKAMELSFAKPSVVRETLPSLVSFTLDSETHGSLLTLARLKTALLLSKDC